MTTFRRFFSLASATFLAASLAVASELTWNFTFASDDVSLAPVGNYTLVTLPDGSNVRDALGAPAIPAKFANILLPDGATDVSIAATGDLVLLASDITPYPVQRVAPKSKPQPPFTAPDPAAYASSSPWPAAVATFEGLHEMQGSTFVSVRVNPLVYIASEKALYYRPSVAVTVTYTAPATAPRSTRSVSQNALATEMVNALVVNPESADSPSAVRRRAAARASTVDYLIITSSTLSNAFQNLATYRASSAGGSFKTLVVTTNTIASSYSGDDIQMKIRNCISSYVNSYGTTYVVLGGDDSVVPDRDCYGNVDNETYEWHMPTDLYYSDLTGTWKASGNTNFGVVAANVDMSPDVIVGRIPVRNASQLSAYLAKVQAFEADTSHTRNALIMGGPAAWCRYYGSKRPSDDVTADGHAGFRASNRTYVSDSEMWNRRLYRDGIKSYWNNAESASTRTVNFACDSLTSWDSSTCGDKVLSASNLQTWLNNGYTHLMFSGHGYPQGWGMESSGNYSTTQAAAQTNLVAFVFTDACLTGAFDEDGIKSSGITVDYGTSDQYTYTSEPCLGEAFIRNANGGALVHMGCARYGWGTPDYQNSDPDDEDSDGYYTNCTASASSDGGPSTVYAYKFYKRLYESAAVSSNRTVGAAFAMSKADMISSCSSDGCERWIQYGLNYLGDPAIALYPRVVPDAAPEFDSATAETNGLTGETISFDFSEHLTAGSPAPSYTLSTSVSSGLYDFENGLLVFQPSAAGTFTFTCTAANGISPNATCVLTVTVTLPPPETPTEVSVVSSDSFTATWSAVTGASTYELLVVEGAASGGGGSGPFTLVTSSSGLTAGEYVILADGIDRAMNNSCSGDSSGVLSYEDVTVDNSTVTTDDASIIWTLAGDASSCTLYNAAAGKYVNPATARNVGWSSEASGSWTLSMSGDLVTVANAANTSWMLQYNSGSPRFALYDNNNQKKLHFYRRNASRALPRAVGDVVYSNTVGNVTSFSVTGLQPETSYSYSVRAVVDGQPTAWSDSVSVTTTEGDAAPAISVEQTSYSTTLGGSDVTFYVTASGSPTPTLALSSATAASADYGFDENDGYFTFTPSATGSFTFVFTATNSEGSDTVTVTVTVSSAPVTVPTLEVDDCTDTTAYALWSACTGVTSYTLQLASDNQFTTGGSGGSVTLFSNDGTDATSAPTGWTYNVSDKTSAYLLMFSGHSVVSEAVDASGCTDLSVSLYIRTYGGTSQPNLAIQYSTDNGTTWNDAGTVAAANTTMAQRTLALPAAAASSTLRLRFAPTTTSSSVGVGIKTIVLTGTEPSGTGSLIATYTVNDTEYTFTGLTPYTVYYARVKGNADWSNVAEFITDQAGDSAPVWSAIPPISVTVGELIPNFYPATYVSGTPAPTITLSQTTASSGEYEFEDGLLVYQPTTIGTFTFTFLADNNIGSPASATLTVNSTGTVPVVSVPQTSYSTSLGGAGVEFTVTATGTPTPTLALSDTTATSGVEFDPDDGYFSFTPYATGTFTFTFTATSSLGSDSVTVTVTVSAAAVTVPELTVTNITETTAFASWTACDDVTTYTLQLTDDAFPAAAAAARSRTPILAEDFSGFTPTSNTDIGSNGTLNNYTTNSGWTGVKVYPEDEQAKIGAGSAQGWLATPALTVSGSLTVVWEARRYGTGDKNTLFLGISEDGTTFTDTTVTLYDDLTVYTNEFTVSGTTAYVRWMGSSSSKARFYLDNVSITTPESGGGDDPGGDSVQEFTVAGTSYTFTGLTPDTTYMARVKGDAGWSDEVYFETLATSGTAPSIEPIADQTYTYGENDGWFTLTATASGTPAPSFSVASDDAPAGSFTIGENDGEFLFEPADVGTFHFTVTAANGVSPAATATFAVTVTGTAPAWSAIPAQSATVGDDFELDLSPYVSGNPAPVLDVAENAHDGVVVDSTFMCTPASAGTLTFTLVASNGVGTAETTLTLNVAAAGTAPAWSALPTPTITVAGDFSFEPADYVSGTPAPTVTLESSSGGADARDFYFENGQFAITPSQSGPGTYSFTFLASNTVGTATATLTVTVTTVPVTVPELTVTNVTETTAVANWTACDGVTTYTLQLTDDGFPAASSAARSRTPILAENFSGFTANGTTDISGSLNNYTTNSGWTGTKVYCNDGEAKVGASNDQGWLKTPALTVSGSLTVVWKARTFGTSDKYTLLLGISEDGTTFTDTTVTLYDDMTVYTNTFEVSGTTAYVRWMGAVASKARFYLDNVSITTPESGGGDDPGGDSIQEFTVTGTTYTFTGLTPDTAYMARVKGDAGWSEEVYFQTEGPVVTGTAPSWDAIPAQSWTMGDDDFTLDLSAYVHGDAPITFIEDDTEWEATVVGDTFVFEPAAAGDYTFGVTASNAYGTAHATFTVAVTAAPEPLSDFQLWLQAHNVATDTAAGVAAPNGYTYWENYVADIDPSGDFLEIGFAATDGVLEIKNASENRYYELLVYEDLTADPVVFDLGPGSADMTEDFPVDDETFFVRVRALLEAP